MEYWPPFAVLFAAFTLQAVWNSAAGSLRKGEKLAPIPAAPGDIEKSKAGRDGGFGINLDVIAIALPLAVLSSYCLRAARVSIASVTAGPDHYRAGAEWLRKNVPPGELIYDVNFSDFPKLFFYDPTHKYVSGLDPLYLYDQHPELVRLNERLSRREEADPAAAIRSVFRRSYPGGVRYLFVGDWYAPPSPEWFRYIASSGKFQPVYEDNECKIFYVLD